MKRQCIIGMSALLLLGLLSCNCGTAESSGSTMAAAAKAHELKMERLLGNRIPVGLYIYLYNWSQNTDPSAHDLDDTIDEIAKRGFNYLYVGGVHDTPVWNRLLTRCEERRIAVVPQLDFAYLWKPESNVKELAEKAIPFIKKYKDHPAIMAFSVCEEPSLAKMPALKAYYEELRWAIPDVQLQLTHNYLPQFKAMDAPYPQIIGTDRYAFWWEFSTGGHRATPSYALRWHQSQMDVYYQLANARNAEFQAVFTADTLETVMSEENVKKAFYPAEIPDGVRKSYLKDIQKLADDKNFGWSKGPNGNYIFWKYYRPPANCVCAMSWLSVMEGARSLAIWHWAPLPKDMKDFAHRTNGVQRHEYISSSAGWDCKGTPQLDEFSAFAVKIQRYAPLIKTMVKECKAIDTERLPQGHQVSANTKIDQPIIELPDDDTAWRSFKVPGYSGKAVLAVNTSVGSWCEGRSPKMLNPKTDVFRINEYGDAIDFVPFKTPRKLNCRILPADMEAFSLKTGTQIQFGDGQSFNLDLEPGGGAFLFIQPEGSDEWPRFKKQFGL